MEDAEREFLAGQKAAGGFATLAKLETGDIRPARAGMEIGLDEL